MGYIEHAVVALIVPALTTCFLEQNSYILGSMTEFYTRALVLDREDVGETDVIAHLFTETHGKILVRAKSSRKITSKSASYLQPLRFIQVRFVTPKKNTATGYILMDALWDTVVPQIPTEVKATLLSLVHTVRELAPENQPDKRVWSLWETILQQPQHIPSAAHVLLQLLGYYTDQVTCGVCKKNTPKRFVIRKELFVCDSCASQLPQDEIQLEI